MTRKEIRLSITGRCNNRCFYCCGEGGDFGDITIQQTDELAELFVSLKMPHVHLTGGEPTLRDDLGHIIKALKTAGIEDIGLTTNGSRLSENLLDGLIESGLNELHIHFPSLNKDTYIETTKRDRDPLHIVNLAEYASRVIPVVLNVPVTTVNLADIGGILDYCSVHNSLQVALIEVVSLDRRRKTDKKIIMKLFENWAGSHDYEEETNPNEFGIQYKIRETGQGIRIVFSNPECAKTLKNREYQCRVRDEEHRIWVGAFAEGYLCTDCMYRCPEEVSLDGIRERIIGKYGMVL